MRSLCLTEIKNCHFKNFDETSFTSIKIVDVETAKSVKSLGLKDNTTNQIRMKIYSVHI